MGTENKVQFNLKNVHYAVLQDDGYSYATPVHIPGAVSLTLDPQGDTSTFYADGIAYYVSATNNGYSGSLEMARFPDVMLEAVWGMVKDNKNVVFEVSSAEPKDFALLFQIDGDKDSALYCFYRCKASRPSIAGNTTTETKTPQTQTANLTAAPLAYDDDVDVIFSRTTANTDAATKSNWFKSVYMSDFQ